MGVPIKDVTVLRSRAFTHVSINYTDNFESVGTNNERGDDDTTRYKRIIDA